MRPNAEVTITSLHIAIQPMEPIHVYSIHLLPTHPAESPENRHKKLPLPQLPFSKHSRPFERERTSVVSFKAHLAKAKSLKLLEKSNFNVCLPLLPGTSSKESSLKIPPNFFGVSLPKKDINLNLGNPKKKFTFSASKIPKTGHQPLPVLNPTNQPVDFPTFCHQVTQGTELRQHLTEVLCGA